jgi:hypothetical protein
VRRKIASYFSLLGRRSEALAEVAEIGQLAIGFSLAKSESDAHFELRD